MEQRRNYSEELVGAIKKELDNAELGDELCVVVTGSFGRNEASLESDMDWFIFADKVFTDNEKQAYLDKVTEVVNNRVAKNAGSTGTFESIVTRNDMLENYGGDKETNQAFTRRMLYLLESKCLYNDSLYESLKREILEKYIKESVSDHNLNRFMLNDIIRYYRTICTDYEYKVNEDGKSWGVRKIKLRFSRKLLYFSGLIAVASTCSLSRKEKIERTLEYLALTPIDRIVRIIGQNQSEKMLAHYSMFLNEISNEKVRESLDKISRETRHDIEDYRRLKNLSQHFNWELEKCFLNEFPQSHPIHAALVF